MLAAEVWRGVGIFFLDYTVHNADVQHARTLTPMSTLGLVHC
jgi:hypothetical protein